MYITFNLGTKSDYSCLENYRNKPHWKTYFWKQKSLFNFNFFLSQSQLIAHLDDLCHCFGFLLWSSIFLNLDDREMLYSNVLILRSWHYSNFLKRIVLAVCFERVSSVTAVSFSWSTPAQTFPIWGALPPLSIPLHPTRSAKLRKVGNYQQLSASFNNSITNFQSGEETLENFANFNFCLTFNSKCRAAFIKTSHEA